MFACCLEDAGYEAAEEAFAALVHTFFDWNEIRVTSLSELSEVMAGLPDPRVAAQSHQADPPRRLRGRLFLRPGGQAEEEPRPDGEVAGETRRHDEVHRRLPGPGGLGRASNPHRRRRDGRPPHRRSGERQGRCRGGGAGLGAGGGQVEGDRVRLAAAPVGGRVHRQPLLSGRPRHPVADRADGEGPLPPATRGGERSRSPAWPARPRRRRKAAEGKPAAEAEHAGPEPPPAGRRPPPRRTSMLAAEPPAAEPAKRKSSAEGLSKRKPR